ncbi:hypothetical protein GE21DRAFT_1048548 [Neurospora crassa]|nr:hypothetical protein GE21DRAFT_1048548 [Neurospora crassa]
MYRCLRQCRPRSLFTASLSVPALVWRCLHCLAGDHSLGLPVVRDQNNVVKPAAPLIDHFPVVESHLSLFILSSLSHFWSRPSSSCLLFQRHATACCVITFTPLTGPSVLRFLSKSFHKRLQLPSHLPRQLPY